MCTCLCSRWVVIILWAPLPKKTSVEFVWEITPPAMCLRAISRNNPGETVSMDVISKVTEDMYTYTFTTKSPFSCP